MYVAIDDSEKIPDSEKKDESVWIPVSLRAIGSKCIMNKHELCGDSKCRCVCHDKKI